MIRHARRFVVFIVGMTIVLFGIALIVLPGPAFIVIPLGIAVLATEFAWARRWLHAVQDTAEKGADKLNIRSPFLRKLFRKKGQDDSQGPRN